MSPVGLRVGIVERGPRRFEAARLAVFATLPHRRRGAGRAAIPPAEARRVQLGGAIVMLQSLSSCQASVVAVGAALLGGCAGEAIVIADAGPRDRDGARAADAGEALDDGGPTTEDASSSTDAGAKTGAAGVLLFGGSDGEEALGDTWTWDGFEWQERETGSSAPDARIDHAMVYDRARDRVVLFGGTTDGNDLFEGTWEWDGEAWEQVAPPGDSPPGRFWHAMAYDAARERVVLFGGTTDGVEFLDDTWEWDGETWEDVSPEVGASPARHSHEMAFDPVGERVLLFGGDDDGFDRPEDTWAWDGASWEDVSPDESPPSRADFAMATDYERERVVLFGGFGRLGAALGDTWQWNGSGWDDVTPESGPLERFWHAMAFDPGTRGVVLFGGSSDNSTLVINDTWTWTGSLWEDEPLQNTPSSRRFHALAGTSLP